MFKHLEWLSWHDACLLAANLMAKKYPKNMNPYFAQGWWLNKGLTGVYEIWYTPTHMPPPLTGGATCTSYSYLITALTCQDNLTIMSS